MVQSLASMGQHASLPKPGRRKSLRSFARRSHTTSNLSHTFTIADTDTPIELLNINQASEEELMTLPGFSREVARSVIDHRRLIGRFRKIEDLALVKGVGAEKLELVRTEICVSNRRNNSCASSRAQSYDSLKSADSRGGRVGGGNRMIVNINKASVFELQCVNGITQEIAAAIVTYRTKKGAFKQVEDLIKVKSIDRIRLNNITRQLTVSDNEDSSSVECETTSNGRPSILTNGFHHLPPPQSQQLDRKPSLKLLATNGLSTSSLYDIFDLLSAYSPRPIIEDVFNFKRNGEPAVRIASWNLYELSLEKINNPGVKEVICRTILENGLSIVAVQDVLDVTALKLICEQLNNPTLRRITEWRDKNHSWNFCMLDVAGSNLGFIYDSDGVIDIELVSLNQGPEDTRKDCDVLIGTFKIGDLNLQLVNLKMEKFAKLDVINDKIKDLISEEDMLMIVVDYSNISDINDDWLSLGGLFPVLLSTTINTNYSNIRHVDNLSSSLSSPHHISNILYNTKVQGQITGINGVIRHGLTHLAIPNGWNWGGPVSPYCPIWTELFLNSNIGTAL